MNHAIVFAFTAALYPTLFAATTVMLLLDHPKRLLLGYWLGAMMTSVTLGLVIVFALDGSAKTTQHTLSPALDIALGGILLVVAYVIRPNRDLPLADRLADRRRKRDQAKQGKGPPRWQRTLSKGSARMTFACGAVLTLPGVSYLIGLHEIADADASTVATVGAVVLFNLIMLVLLELPLLAYVFAPDWTPGAVERFKAWFNANSRRIAFRLALIFGLLVIGRGVIELL